MKTTTNIIIHLPIFCFFPSLLDLQNLLVCVYRNRQICSNSSLGSTSANKIAQFLGVVLTSDFWLLVYYLIGESNFLAYGTKSLFTICHLAFNNFKYLLEGPRESADEERSQIKISTQHIR